MGQIQLILTAWNYVPETYLMLKATKEGSLYYPHFVDGEWKTERLNVFT